MSFGRGFYKETRAAPHEWLVATGGAIGDGIPMATGAAVAGKGRRVIDLQADGSAMYSLQGLRMADVPRFVDAISSVRVA